MLKDYIVYKTTNMISKKFYIGVHKVKSDEFDGYFGSSSHLRNAIKKYGKQNFIRETLLDNLTKDEAFDIESLLIDDQMCTRKDIYNKKSGGFGGSNKGRQFHNQEEYRQKLQNGNFKYQEKLKSNGLPHHNKGRKHSDETKKKHSESRKGMNTGADHWTFGLSKEDMPKGFLGKSFTDESKEKISKSLLKYYKTNKSYERTEEIRKKISESKKGSVTSDEVKKKLSDATKGIPRGNQPIIECPYCNKSGGSSNMKRYHFDKCKFKAYNHVE